MKVIGIDPGTTRSGLVVCHYEGQSIPTVKRTEKTDNYEVMSLLHSWAKGKHKFVVEYPVASHLPASNDLFRTIWWIGKFDTVVKQRCGKLEEISRPEVKLFLLNKRAGKDSQIRQAVIDIYGGNEKAIGNKKCQKCKGKGWTGRDHVTCTSCKGNGWDLPPGPLKDVSGDCWQALAAVLTWKDKKRAL